MTARTASGKLALPVLALPVLVPALDKALPQALSR
jgi:hypothetical protein